MELLASEPAFQLTVFETAVPCPFARQSFLFQKLQQHFSDADEDQPVPWRSRLRLDAVAVDPDWRKTEWQKYDLAVLIWLDAVPFEKDCAGWATFGVWTIRPGGPEARPGNLPFWPEVRDRIPVTKIALLRHNQSFQKAAVLATHTAATRQGWRFALNRNDPLRGITVLIFEALLELHPPKDLIVNTPAIEPVNPPGTIEAAAFALRQMYRSVSVRLQSRGRKPGWFIAVRRDRQSFTPRNERFLPQGFAELPAPPGHGFADPFPLHWQGQDWVLVEDISPDGKGCLAALQIKPDGSIAATIPVLERPYHLSYPFPIVAGNDLFLLPESALDNTVQLLRCSRDSFAGGAEAWKLEKILYAGCLLVDTTPFFHDGKWYFFTTRVDNGPHMFLFVADRLDGAWQYHPCNPVSTDVRAARSAGALFWRGSRLFRPLQDCSVRYGYAIVIKEITRLTPTEFEERTAETILPDWSPGLLGTHTLNSNGNLEAIDGIRFTA